MLTFWTKFKTHYADHVSKGLVRGDLDALGLSLSWWRRDQDRPTWKAAIEKLLQHEVRSNDEHGFAVAQALPARSFCCPRTRTRSSSWWRPGQGSPPTARSGGDSSWRRLRATNLPASRGSSWVWPTPTPSCMMMSCSPSSRPTQTR